MRASRGAVGVLLALAYLVVVFYAYYVEQESLALLVLVVGFVAVLVITRRHRTVFWGFFGTLATAFLGLAALITWAEATGFAP